MTSSGALPDPGMTPVSPALQVGSLLLSHQGSPLSSISTKDPDSSFFSLRTRTRPSKCFLSFVTVAFGEHKFISVF